MSIRIDKEFESLIPPLSDDEFKQLEENCVKEGIRDALVVWKVPNGDQILVDGHNRMKISAKHGGIPFQIKEMSFNLREDAIAWIIRNQFGRRNLSLFDRGELALKLKPILAKEAKERMTNAPQKKAERKKAIDKIWQEHDVDTARVLVAQKREEFGREDRAETMADEKYIYFARFGNDQLKVGSSICPEDRVRQLSVSCPGIRLVEAIPFGAGAEKHENSIKKKYGQYRVGNECYQCPDEILSEMIAFTKKEAARKSNTDYELAKVAGVSHDTIHKVETIVNSARDDIKEAVKSGEMSINQGYREIKGLNKTNKQAQKELIDSVKQEREEFKEQKSDGVVSFSDAVRDKENAEFLAQELYRRCMRLGSQIDIFCMEVNEKEVHLAEELKPLSDAEKQRLRWQFESWRNKLLQLLGELIE